MRLRLRLSRLVLGGPPGVVEGAACRINAKRLCLGQQRHMCSLFSQVGPACHARGVEELCQHLEVLRLAKRVGYNLLPVQED